MSICPTSLTRSVIGRAQAYRPPPVIQGTKPFVGCANDPRNSRGRRFDDRHGSCVGESIPMMRKNCSFNFGVDLRPGALAVPLVAALAVLFVHAAPARAQNPPVTVAVDANANRRPIDPN